MKQHIQSHTSSSSSSIIIIIIIIKLLCKFSPITLKLSTLLDLLEGLRADNLWHIAKKKNKFNIIRKEETPILLNKTPLQTH